MDYHNENDPFAVSWLSELMARGLIRQGHIDSRSIVDVHPDDLNGYTHCHFFSGIGGWAYALQLAQWPPTIPVWTGSCPCQPFSIIGTHTGESDERHLWPELARLVDKRRPATILGEQVASKAGREWFNGIRIDLEGMQFAVAAADLCAACVGAPTGYQRLYWVAQASGKGLEGFAGHGYGGEEPGRFNTVESGPITTAGASMSDPSSLDAVPMLRGLHLHNSRDARLRLRLPADGGMGDGPLRPWADFDALPCFDGWRRVESGTFPLVNGIPKRVGRFRGFGNAINPILAAEFIGAYMDTQTKGGQPCQHY